MKNIPISAAGIAAALLLPSLPVRAQIDFDLPKELVRKIRADQLRKDLSVDKVSFTIEQVTVVNMIPNAQSNEIANDAEPNLAVDPTNTSRIIGSAFTNNPTGAVNLAPVFTSTDGGLNWTLVNSVPSGNGRTGDITVDFAKRGNTLYTGILRGGGGLRQMLLRDANPFDATAMTVLRDDSTVTKDQPYVTATTSLVKGADRDRVYFGFNFFGNRAAVGGDGRTASAEFSLGARTAPAPAGFTVTPTLEARNTNGQDMPAIRCAVHDNGVIYAVFYRWVSGNLPKAACDVVVVRDNNFASDAPRFAALTDPSDGVAGRRVAGNRVVPAFPASLGLTRLVASNLSIAVDPNNAANVYVAWCDSNSTSPYTLHVRRSTDSGKTWTADLRSLAKATNPALAITTNGRVGLLFQQLTGTAPNRRWRTHFQRRFHAGANTWSDMLLANTPDSALASGFFLGDYCDLIAVGGNFFGTFSAANVPDSANFPRGVRWQRDANFATHQNRNLANTNNVPVSIDNFFFKVTRATIVNICELAPSVCDVVVMDPGRFTLNVDTIPFRVRDPIPKNCLVKFDCPGCSGMALCPPFYHMYMDGLDPEKWEVRLFDKLGNEVKHMVRPTANGIVLSFRPSRANFREKEIGDYEIGLATVGQVEKRKYEVKTRLEVTDFPVPKEAGGKSPGG